MKSLFVKSVILLILVLTLGCASITKLMQDGIGLPISTIIDHMGPPSRVTPDGKGGSVYIWEQWVPTGWFNGYLRSNTFWADSNGIIYKWR
jgi:hypothetical protein